MKGGCSTTKEYVKYIYNNFILDGDIEIYYNSSDILK